MRGGGGGDGRNMEGGLSTNRISRGSFYPANGLMRALATDAGPDSSCLEQRMLQLLDARLQVINILVQYPCENHARFLVKIVIRKKQTDQHPRCAKQQGKTPFCLPRLPQQGMQKRPVHSARLQ